MLSDFWFPVFLVMRFIVIIIIIIVIIIVTTIAICSYCCQLRAQKVFSNFLLYFSFFIYDAMILLKNTLKCTIYSKMSFLLLLHGKCFSLFCINIQYNNKYKSFSIKVTHTCCIKVAYNMIKI